MNGKPSRALDFFEQVKTDGLPFLKTLINSDPRTFETDWLDFKGERSSMTSMSRGYGAKHSRDLPIQREESLSGV